MTPTEFRELRKAHGLTINKLAQLLDCSPDAVKAWGAGRRPISRITEIAILHVLASTGWHMVRTDIDLPSC